MRYFFIYTTLVLFFSCNSYEGIDITKPSAYISFPKNGALASDSLIVSAIASDDIGIEYIELWINQEKTDQKDYSPPFEFIIDTHNLSGVEEGGAIELTVKAFDTSENESALSSTVEVFLDNHPPTKVILNPIIEEDGILQFNWSKCRDLDFYAYVLMINNTHFSFIDTIFSSNILETQIEYNPNSIEFFGVQVIDKGFKTSISNNVQPISFEFNEIDNGFYQFGPNNELINVPESFQLMVSEVNNLQYRSYLSVARELNEIDTTNIGPWILDNEGNILYDLENGYVRWDGDNFYIHNILENLLIPNYPITHVSWLGAKHFAEFFDFRLPHETEWEKAAADNGDFDYPWGNEYDDLDYSPINEIESTYANYFENESHESQPEPYEPGGEINNIGTPGLAPVQFIEDEINPFWFFDKCPEECHSFNHMAGNVWEWVNHDNGYSGSQMCRGGSWRSSKQELRVWSTKLLESHTTGDHIGFRCAK